MAGKRKDKVEFIDDSDEVIIEEEKSFNFNSHDEDKNNLDELQPVIELTQEDQLKTCQMDSSVPLSPKAVDSKS